MQREPTGEPADVGADLGRIWGTIDAMLDGFVAALPRIVIAIVVLGLFYAAARIARVAIRRATRRRASAHLGQVLGRLAQLAIVAAGVLVAVAIVAPSVTPADLLSVLGIGGIAVGFAFRDILQNFLAGILILLRQPFRTGDQIIHGSHEGTVVSIESRATIIETYDGRHVLIPNGEVYTKAVVVNTAKPLRRSEYDVGVGYGDDVELARERISAALERVEGVAEQPAPDVLAFELAPSSVNLRARWWTESHQAAVLDVRDRVIRAIKEELADAAIDLPFPTRVVLFHDQTEATDGDRRRQREGWPAGDAPPEPARAVLRPARRAS